MSGASDAATKLKEAALLNYPLLREHVVDLGKVVTDLRAAEDLMDVLVAVDAYALILKGLGEICEDMKKAADRAEVAAMQLGATSFQANGHTVSLRKKPAPVVIHDVREVPGEMFTQPEPQPDHARIRTYLKYKQVNWATLGEAGYGLQRKPIA